MTEHARQPQLDWDLGTAYDFFVSLAVLHDPEKFGLRASWAAGVRSRLPTDERDLLQKAVSSIWPIPWVHSLPHPKDSAMVLGTLADIPPAERLLALRQPITEEISALLSGVRDRGSWRAAEQKLLTDLMCQDDPGMRHSVAKMKQLTSDVLDLEADAAATGELLLSAYENYYEQFFAEEELRIRPSLDNAYEHARDLAETLPLDQLLLELSQGVELNGKMTGRTRLVLAPSFWSTPLMMFADLGDGEQFILYGARPPEKSLVPGDPVPDALYQALKALSDPTRLRILRYLSAEPLAPSDLARRLRLRAPTVIHHLDILRLARLVHVTFHDEGRRYAAREGAVDSAVQLLKYYLASSEK